MDKPRVVLRTALDCLEWIELRTQCKDDFESALTEIGAVAATWADRLRGQQDAGTEISLAPIVSVDTAGQCSACVRRGKTWEGDDPRCAFPLGVFVSENWNCATVNRLRHEIDQSELVRAANEDEHCVVLPLPESDSGDFMVVNWYKNRGRTYGCLVLNEGFYRPALISDARLAIDHLQRHRERGY